MQSEPTALTYTQSPGASGTAGGSLLGRDDARDGCLGPRNNMVSRSSPTSTLIASRHSFIESCLEEELEQAQGKRKPGPVSSIACLKQGLIF